jgi:hypothetical protein
MRSKLFLIFALFLFSSFTDTQLIQRSRDLYLASKDNSDSTQALFDLTNNQSNNTLKAYHGASYAFKAKHGNNPIKKLDNLKKGLKIINDAVLYDVINVELRFIRLSIEENIPSVVSFTSHIEADKKMINSSLKSSHPLYNTIKAYMDGK